MDNDAKQQQLYQEYLDEMMIHSCLCLALSFDQWRLVAVS